MESELWSALYRWIQSLDQQTPKKEDCHFSDGVIVQVYLWSVLCDRPVCWACQEQNWRAAGLWRPQKLPSQPTMSRRSRQASFLQFLRDLEQAIRQSFVLLGKMLVSYVDGKPLPISRHSQDPDSDFGRGSNGWYRGYQFHGCWNHQCLPYWELTCASNNEARVGRRILRHLDSDVGGYVLGDCKYDSTDLHRRCSERGHQLLAPQNVRGRRAGRKRRLPERLHALEMLQRSFGRALLHLRDTVESYHGNWCSFGGGLSPLPSWVRRLHRVRLWVQGKLLINAMRIRTRLERVA